MNRWHNLERIDRVLDAAVAALEQFTPGAFEPTMKSGDDPVTAADLAANDALLDLLPRTGDGCLFEETANSNDRLDRERVWIVDPIEGTREFVDGIPEWSVSVGLVEHGQLVAGGICNPATGERIIGSVEIGVQFTGHRPVTVATSLSDAVVLASRSEIRRGGWERILDQPFTVVPRDSVAHKLALVAAGRADATWTLVPKQSGTSQLALPSFQYSEDGSPGYSDPLLLSPEPHH